MTDQQLEQHLRTWYRAEVGEAERAPAALQASVAAIPHAQSPFELRVPWRLPTLALPTRLAVAAVIGVLAVGGAFYLLRSTQPPIGTPSQSPGLSANPSQPASPSAGPTSVDVQPEPAVYVFNKGTGTAAECGDSQGGCIPRMWVANLDESGAHELLPGQTGCQRAVAWSPDGTRLLFTRSDCRRDPEGGMMGADRFYLTDASGSDPRLVDTGCVDLCVSEYDAVFSADGLRILFIRTRSVPPPPSATDPVTGKPAQGTEVKVLASLDLATNRVTELGKFDACDQCSIDKGMAWEPVWSPDRTQIVYTSRDLTQNPEPMSIYAILVADADGGNVHQLSASGGAPAWSPDGTRIAFRSERYSWKGTWKPGVVVHPSFDIYTIRPDGTDLVRLTSDEVSLNPEWSPDGRIWFIRNRAQFWVMDADGANAAQLADEPAFHAWQVQPTP